MTSKSAGAYNHINYTTEYKSSTELFFFIHILINLIYGCIGLHFKLLFSKQSMYYMYVCRT